MAGSKSNYLENEILDHVYGGGDYARPATVYVALYTVAPTDAGGGTEVPTANWTNYARASVTNNATNWPAAVSGAKANGTEVDFGTATIAAVDYVTVVAFGIFDDPTAGNLLNWGDLTASRKITDGAAVKFATGDIDLTED